MFLQVILATTILTLLLSKYQFIQIRRRRQGPMSCVIIRHQSVPTRLSELVRRGGRGRFRLDCRAKRSLCLTGKCKQRVDNKCDVRMRRLKRSSGKVFFIAGLLKPRSLGRTKIPSCPYVIVGAQGRRGPMAFQRDDDPIGGRSRGKR